MAPNRPSAREPLQPSKNAGLRVAQGTLRAYFLFDVADTIDLSALSELGGERNQVPQPYLQFPVPPLSVALPDADVAGVRARVRLKFFDYGVLSVLLAFDAAGPWETVVAIADLARGDERVLHYASQTVKRILEQYARAFDEPHEPLIEDYFIVEVNRFEEQPGAQALFEQHGGELAGVLSGERKPLSETERTEILRSRFSYHDDDLTLVQWDTAFVFDRPESARAIAEILEFANSQLLELRTYDALLDRELDTIYKLQPGRAASSWRGRRESERASTLRYLIVDVLELIDRSSNALKIVGDAYYARIYRAAATRLGLSDWQQQIDAKLASVGEMYRFFIDQARNSRDTFLEFIIIALIALELLVAIVTLVHH